MKEGFPIHSAEVGVKTRRTRPGLQTLHVADELDSRLARIAADARLAEQETGLSTLFLAFGFLRSSGAQVACAFHHAFRLLLV